MHINERLDDHQKFRELAVLAQTGAISDIEQFELNNHLRVCPVCRQIYEEYSLIARVGMPFLAASCDQHREAEEWDNRPARDRLMARLESTEEWNPPDRVKAGDSRHAFDLQKTVLRWGVAALAACVLLAVAAHLNWMGGRTRMVKHNNPSATASGLGVEQDANQQRIAAQNEQLSHLHAELGKAQQEVLRLQAALHAAESHAATVSAIGWKTTEQLREASVQRDKLAGQLRDTEQSYDLLQAELTNLRGDREKTLLHSTSLETKVEELEASAREQERRLKDDEQYLSADRDIRELMGARKLYIADVFDVDSGSRTRKPFGRVFYTQSKSLIFYAFDLDRQPGVKTASAFQVWGQRDGVEEQRQATNLGILYMDSESNRRWVLKIDDPKQLSEIDAVFVTMEPRGGSQKPTGKPFLYALLRREANHP